MLALGSSSEGEEEERFNERWRSARQTTLRMARVAAVWDLGVVNQWAGS